MASPVVTTIPDSAVSVELAPGSGKSDGILIANESSATLYVRFGSDDAATDDFSFKLTEGQVYESAGPVKSAVQGIWASNAGGSAYVTELRR